MPQPCTAVDESLRMLMEAWGSLLGKGMGITGPGDVGATPPAVLEGADAVFRAYVQAGLAAAAAAAHEEDDGQEEEGGAGAAALDDRLALAAAVV